MRFELRRGEKPTGAANIAEIRVQKHGPVRNIQTALKVRHQIGKGLSLRGREGRLLAIPHQADADGHAVELISIERIRPGSRCDVGTGELQVPTI